MNPVLEVIAPVFGIVAIGYVLVRTGVFTAAASDGLTKFMFYVAVPAMLFHTLATTELPATIPWRLLAAFYVPSFALFGMAMLIAGRMLGWARNEQGIAGISGAYSNMVLLGLPLVLSAFGETAALPLFILLAPQAILMFPLTTFVIEVYGHVPDCSGNGRTHPVARSIGRLAMNPVIVSLALGVLANFSGLRFPGVFETALVTLSNAAPACALTALGASLAHYELLGGVRSTLPFVALKNIAHPLLVAAACVWLAVDPEWAKIAVLLAAMPSGINAFIFARTYDLRTDVVTKTIVVSTLFSVLTVSLLLYCYLDA